MTKIISGTLTISRDLRKSDQILEKYLKSLAKSDYRVTSMEQKIIASQEDLPAQSTPDQRFYGFNFNVKTIKTPGAFTEIKYEKEVRV
jgi:hypothetical protein